MSKSTFEKLDILDVIPSSKTDMVTRHGIFFSCFAIYCLEMHHNNGKEDDGKEEGAKRVMEIDNSSEKNQGKIKCFLIFVWIPFKNIFISNIVVFFNYSYSLYFLLN